MGDWSHVGVMIPGNLLPYVRNIKRDTWYVWEATASGKIAGYRASNVLDAVSQAGRLGVQLRELKEVVRDYTLDNESKVAWAPLLDNPFVRKPNEVPEEFNIRQTLLTHRIMQLYNEYGRDLYDCNCCNCLAALFSCFRCCRCKSDDRLICSQFAALIYQGLGILDQKFNAMDVVPADFLGFDKDGIPNMVREIIPLIVR